MNINKTFNYSPNFNIVKRKKAEIKFIVFHYTGMKTEKQAINRLTNIQSEVSSHYFIKNNGEIVVLVPDLYIAWHAGKSFWKKFSSLNKNSIGIEISNPGHGLDYKKFSNKQINSLIRLTKYLIQKYNIKSQNILGHSDIAPNRKKDPGEKFPWKYLSQKKIGFWHELNKKTLIRNRKLFTTIKEKKLFFENLVKIGYSKKNKKKNNIDKAKYLKIMIKAFQRRFRPEIINGKVDQECLIISQNLIKKLSNYP